MLQQRATQRRAFTLLEMLMVILIITILAALILPAISAARRRASLVQQTSEIAEFNTALENFKQKHGIYPPSRICLIETGLYDLDKPLHKHSVKYLRQIWPNIVLQTYNTTAPMDDPTTNILWCLDDTSKDPADPADWTSTYELEGDECLVFFLGGIAEFDRSNVTSIVLHGFTRRPTNPGGIPIGSDPRTLEREPPLFEFKATRLIVRDDNNGQVSENPTNTEEFGTDAGYVDNNDRTDKLPSYLSIVGERPIAYFSSYEGLGYRPHDMNLPSDTGDSWYEDLDPGLTAANALGFQMRWQAPNSGVFPTYQSQVPNPYSVTLGIPPNDKVVRFHNERGFQLITTGADNKYGPGNQLPRDPSLQENFDLTPHGASADNVTNVTGAAYLSDYNAEQLTK